VHVGAIAFTLFHALRYVPNTALGSLSFKNPKRIARTEPTDWEIPAMQWVAANGRQVLALIAEKVDVRKWKLIMVEE
jgi:hypothetical protein